MQRIPVVAGVLRDGAGRVLLTQRRAGTHLAGCWEFPGGKVEPGEAAVAALQRELHEETGVDLTAAEPLIRVPWAYPDKQVELDVYCVHFSGNPHGREGQALAWHAIEALAGLSMPPADRPVVTALKLPRTLLITPEPGVDHDEFLLALDAALARGARLVQLRAKQMTATDLRALARACQDRMRRFAAGRPRSETGEQPRLILNGNIGLAQELRLDGVQLPAQVAARFVDRPVPRDSWLGVSCHDADELAHALRINADFVTLGPVRETGSHPGLPGIGWDRYSELVRDFPLPSYALGGMQRDDIPRARAAGAFGIAGISSLWT